jgi:hypothetical protein
MLRWLKAVLEWIFGHQSSWIQLSLQSANTRECREAGDRAPIRVKARAILTVE